MRVDGARALADSSDCGLLGEQSSKNVRFPALDATNKKQTKLQTVNDISIPFLSACMDKK